MNNLKDKIALVTAITEQSIEISDNSIIDIFVDYSSHIKSLSVKVLLNGWSEGNYKPDFNKTIYLDWNNAEKELQEALDYLGGIKDEHCRKN